MGTARAPVVGSAVSWPTCNAIVSNLLGNSFDHLTVSNRYSSSNICMLKLFYKESCQNPARK
jgi:hypothetical protein